MTSTFPLGGNRCRVGRHILNLLIVWLLTGIWHGSGYAFIVWGLGYFLLLVAEKYLPFMKYVVGKWYSHFYVMFFVNLLWIPFRMGNLGNSIVYIRRMFCPDNWGNIEKEGVMFLPLILLSLTLCLPWGKLFERHLNHPLALFLKRVSYAVLLVAGTCAMLNSTDAPYIYGNF